MPGLGGYLRPQPLGVRGRQPRIVRMYLGVQPKQGRKISRDGGPDHGGHPAKPKSPTHHALAPINPIDR